MLDFPTKATVIQHVDQAINRRLNELEVQFADLQQSLLSDTKSSAGDKHETSRAMTQLEIEKLGKQLHDLNQMRTLFQAVDSLRQNTTIQVGSLIRSSEGWYFICIPFGKVTIDNNLTVFCMSNLSPLGKLFVGKKAGDRIVFNNREIEIFTIL